MSFSNEIKDFVGGFKSGWTMASENQRDKLAREEREALKATQDDAEGRAGSYGGPASTALPTSTSGAGAPIRDAALPRMTQGDNADVGGVVQRASQAISGIESGGRYDALGPKHPKYGYAVGKYQVMESNIPSWTREALGREMSSDEFRSSPEAQEKVFQHRFGGYLQKTGSVADAASMWHSGRPLAKARAAGARDSLGTRTEDYARRVQNQVGKRADVAIPVDDETETTQFAAEGGLIRDPEEAELVAAEEARTLDPDRRARMRRPADAPFMPGPRVQTPRGSYEDATTQGPTETAETVGPDEAHEVTPVRETPSEAATIPAPTPRQAIPAGEAVQASDTMTVPTPPRRPSDAELAAPPRPSRQPVTRPGNPQPDNGAPLPGEGMTAESDEPYDARRFADPAKTAEVSKSVFDYIGEFLGLKSAAIPGAAPDYDRNVNKLVQYAATPAEVRQVDQTIDPQGTLPVAARAMARMNAGYEFYLQRGEPQKALNYAMSMVLYARSHSMMAGRLAQAALQAGDVPGAARVIQEAHNQAPDGTAIEVVKAGPNGVEYAMTDLDGNLTQRGRASTDELMHLATGMTNGSVWLEQMSELTRLSPRGMSPSQRLREEQAERKRAEVEGQNNARADFDDAATPESDEFLASLNPDQRKAYDRMDIRSRGRVRREWSNEQKRKQGVARDEEKSAKAERAGQDEQEFSAHANAIAAAQAALDRQMQEDPDDPVRVPEAQAALQQARDEALKWAEADAGRAKFGNQLRGTTGRGGARQAIPTAPSIGQVGRGATKEQKEEAAIDAEVRRSHNKTFRDGPPMKEDFERHEALRADGEFRKHYSGADAETARGVDEAATARGMKFDKEDDKFAVRQAGEEIASANGFLPDQAARYVQAALDANGKYRVTPDGKVQFGDAPPIRLGRSGLLAIAGILGRREKASAPGATTVTNPLDQETNAGAQMRREDEAAAKSQREQMTAQSAREAEERRASLEERLRGLGGEPQPGWSVERLEREINDQKRLNGRNFRNRALPPIL